MQFGALRVKPQACYTRPATEAANTDAFVEVDEITLQGEVKRIFSGWMFAASPGPVRRRASDLRRVADRLQRPRGDRRHRRAGRRRRVRRRPRSKRSRAAVNRGVSLRRHRRCSRSTALPAAAGIQVGNAVPRRSRERRRELLLAGRVKSARRGRRLRGAPTSGRTCDRATPHRASRRDGCGVRSSRGISCRAGGARSAPFRDRRRTRRRISRRSA